MLGRPKHRFDRWWFALVVTALLTHTAFAQITYITNNDTITITGYTDVNGEVSIPDIINGRTVTGIADYAFTSKSSLTGVSIPKSVLVIGTNTFSYTPDLIAITVDALNPAYVSVDGILFDKDATTLIHYPAGKLGTSYTLPQGATCIAGAAFTFCTNLAVVTIGNSVTNIGPEPFADCANLSTIVVDAQNPAYSSVDGVLFTKNPPALLKYPQGKLESTYTIPNGVITIASGAFFPCINLTLVAIPGTVINIEKMAFANCSSLTNVIIPDGVTSIGDHAFNGCTNLTSVSIPNSVTNTGLAMYSNCTSLTNVAIGDGLTAIANHMFQACTRLSHVTIGDVVSRIGSWSFAGCNSLTTISIPNSVTNIGDGAFSACRSLASIAIPDEVVSVGAIAFQSCSGLTNVILGNGLLSVGDRAFISCSSLATVILGNSITNLGLRTFYQCTSLTSITIPNTVPRIQTETFYRCTNLTSVTIGSGVTSIGGGALASCTSLTNLTIPASVRGISINAFVSCPGLRDLHFRGNPPFENWDMFLGSQIDRLYYLPGTTGWGATFAGRPTALWLPLVQTCDDYFGMRMNQFGFNIAWASGQTVVVEACTNLANSIWFPLHTNTLTSDTLYFTDPNSQSHPARLYRIRSP